MKTIQAMSIFLIAGVLATSCGYNRDPRAEAPKKDEAVAEVIELNSPDADTDTTTDESPGVKSEYIVTGTGKLEPKATMEVRRSMPLLNNKQTAKLAPRFAPMRWSLDFLFNGFYLKNKFNGCHFDYSSIQETKWLNARVLFDLTDYVILESTKSDFDVLKELVEEKFDLVLEDESLSEEDYLLSLALEHQILIQDIVEDAIRKNLVNGYKVSDGVQSIADLNEDIRVNTDSGATLRDVKPMHAIAFTVEFRPQPGLQPERMPETKVICQSQAPQTAEDAVEYLGAYGKVKNFEAPEVEGQ